MNAVRRADGALGPSGLVALMEEAWPRRIPRERLARVAVARRFGNIARALNSVSLLVELGVLEESGDGIAVAPGSTPDAGWEAVIRSAVLGRFRQLLRDAAFISAIQPGEADGELRLDALQLPGRDHGYPILLLQFGIATRIDPLDRNWVVATDCVPPLLDLIAELNRSDDRRHLSLEGLLSIKARQAAAGRRAEAFALGFEKARLAGHRFLDQVRLISDDDVGAGYDLLSFDRLRSLRHDRMIEVKGFEAEKAFHWSEGEIRAARLLRDRYWLYLVDRGRMGAEAYEPEMIQDPYAYFIEQNPEGWGLEPQSYKFTAPTNEAAARSRSLSTDAKVD